jgi:GTP-binding protein EngB required for normal cell division
MHAPACCCLLPSMPGMVHRCWHASHLAASTHMGRGKGGQGLDGGKKRKSAAAAAGTEEPAAAAAAAAAGGDGPVAQAATLFLPSMFRCPISGDLMEDPVVAEDGNTYSKGLLEAWFEECPTREGMGGKIVSPVTREPMGKKLKARKDYAAGIAEIRERSMQTTQAAELGAGGEPSSKKKKSKSGADSSVAASDRPSVNSSLNQLGKVFAHLDPLRKLLARSLDGWEPPQLVVVGNENAGKSSVLERLCMIPIFPRDEQLCTRMPIHVRLRRGPAKAPQLEVVSTSGGILNAAISVPAECAHDDVRRTMERIVREQNADLTGVTADRKILLHVQSPNVPTLDLVDLPGVVAAAANGEPSNMPDQTKNLVQQHIQRHKVRSVFLACVDAPTAPNSSTAVQILVQQQVLDNTIGVVTMCDWAMAPQQKEKVRKRLSQAAGSDAVELKRGYVATMNAPIVDDTISNLEKLQNQADKELEFFKEYLPEETDRTTTTVALLSRIEEMFLDNVKRSWIPTTLVKLGEERKNLDQQNADLGLPAAYGDVPVEAIACDRNRDELSELRTAAKKTMMDLFEKEIPAVHRQFSAKYVEVLSGSILAAIGGQPSAETYTISMAPHEVDPYLQTVAAKLQAVIGDEDNLQAANDELAKWVGTKVKEESASVFKLNRFPKIAEELENKVRASLPNAEDTRDRIHNSIEQHLSIDGPSIAIRHTFAADKTVTAAVTFSARKITGAILQWYMCEQFRVLHDLLANKEQVVGDVVDATLQPGTKDACDSKRREIIKQIQLVNKAEQGIIAIRDQGVCVHTKTLQFSFSSSARF